MPELPEVTTVIGILNNELRNKKIIDIKILYPSIIDDDNDFFIASLQNKTINFITRYGKFIIFHLSEKTVLISHLRMEGKYSLISKNTQLPPHSCVVFKLENDEYLVYHDVRKFGKMYIKTEDNYLSSKPISQLGLEPFDIKSDKQKEDLFKKLQKKKPIKELLLDQTIMAGIGNIYADEICYDCSINPLTLGSNLTREKSDEILASTIKILNHAIELGGSTIKSYHPKDGVDGRFQIELKAYGKVGTTCPKCGTLFHKIFLNGRGTTYCPNCQLDVKLKKAIGITGLIGSGKSLVLQYFKERNFKTFSCDEIVSELYEDASFAKKIIKIFGKGSVTQDFKINKQFIREAITNNEELQGFLENLVFPEVEKRLIQIVKENEKPAIEVPLLFKGHLEYLFSNILVVSADEDVAIKRIIESRNYNPKEAIKLYKRNNVVSSKDIIEIKNNYSTKEQLFDYLDRNIINKL